MRLWNGAAVLRVVECRQGWYIAVVKVPVGQAWAVVCGSGESCGWPAGWCCDHGVRGAVWLCRKWSWPWVML